MTTAAEWGGRVGQIWAEEWQHTDHAFAGLDPALLRAITTAAPATGPCRVLDIGCGAGATSMALAASFPDAQILGVDLAAPLIFVARERAALVSNVSFLAGDALLLATERGPFDLLISRHGVMFFAEPETAFRTLRSAVAPGGAFVLSCFADASLNDFAGPLAVALGLAMEPSDDRPGPFSLADPQKTAALLAEAGWRDATPEQVPFRYRVGEGPAALDDAVRFLSRVGPAAAALRRADEAGRAALTADLRRYLQPFVRDNVVDLQATAWLWTAYA